MKSKQQLRNIAMMISDDYVSLDIYFSLKKGDIQSTFRAVALREFAEGLEKDSVIAIYVPNNPDNIRLARVGKVDDDCDIEDNVEYSVAFEQLSIEAATKFQNKLDDAVDQLHKMQRKQMREATLRGLGFMQDDKEKLIDSQ